MSGTCIIALLMYSCSESVFELPEHFFKQTFRPAKTHVRIVVKRNVPARAVTMYRRVSLSPEFVLIILVSIESKGHCQDILWSNCVVTF